MKATAEVRKALQSKLEEMIRNEEPVKEVSCIDNLWTVNNGYSWSPYDKRSYILDQALIVIHFRAARINSLKVEISNGYTWPYRSKPTFLISDIRPLWRSVPSAQILEIKNVG